MKLSYRLTMLVVSLAVILTVGRFSMHNFEFATAQFWFISGALLLIMLSLVDQPHFSKDGNVFVNGATALVSLFIIVESQRTGIWWIFCLWANYLIIASFVLMALRSRELYLETKAVQFFSRVNRAIGRPESIFSAFFLWGVFLQFAYGAGKDGKTPVRDKKKLVDELRKALDATTLFCANQGVVLAAIEQLVAASMDRLQKVDDAVNALISPDPLRREFLGYERLVNTLYNAVKPDPAALEFAGRVACLAAIAAVIRAKLSPNPADISKVMGDVAKLLDSSITGIEMPGKPSPLMDLSKIDFEALRKRFKESKHKNTDLEVLKAAIRAQLEKLIRLNKTRLDFQEKFEELIESYNAGSRNIEDLFNDLIALSRTLSAEQQRHVRENMTEEELVIFDILTRPAPALSTDERAEVKKIARELLSKLIQLLVINWRQKSTARAQLKLAIEDVLETGLPQAYTNDLYNQKCSALFEHFYENYTDKSAGTYAA